MCTVTFWPTDRGYRLGMNRDEQRTRPLGLPPERFQLGDTQVLLPREPNGGTWISVNHHGVSFALINWYAITAPPPQTLVSRGEVILNLLDSRSSEDSERKFKTLPLPQIRPFRLIGFYPSEMSVDEWQWDQMSRQSVRHRWEPKQWISSGHDEPAAHGSRSAVFDQARHEPDAGEQAWFRRLHASHAPQRGAGSTCMHRPDAHTVSYTEIEAIAGKVLLRHLPQAPCRGWATESIHVIPGPT